MTHRRFKYESLLYLLAFLIALSLRFIQLGAMPLADAEAAPALQALRIAEGESPTLAPHPFYILSTSLTFFLYGGGTNLLARFFPALIGSLLVLAPLLFDDRLKPRPALLLAFFLALDPGLTALSRQAASPIFAITFLAFTFGFLNKNKPAPAAAFAALALLSGPSVWLGILTLAIPWAILQGFKITQPSAIRLPPSALIPFLLTFILGGSLFLLVPNGLSAAFASIPVFISRWSVPSDFPAGRLFLALLVYQLLPFLLGLIAVIRGWFNGSARVIPLSVWLLVSLLLAVFLPSRQISDLAWTILPLCALAALELARNLNVFPEERREIAGVALLTAFIWIFAWMDFAGLSWLPPDSPSYRDRFILLIGALFLLLLSLLLVALGWSIRTAKVGGIWGTAFALGLLGLSGALGAAGLRGQAHPELWHLPSAPMQAELLQSTAREVSRLGFGSENAASVVIAGVNSTALEWALRDHQVTRVETLGNVAAPDIVVTPMETDPVLVAAYRGQDFNWRQNPLWNGAQPSNWLRWVALREMPQSGEAVILWVRDDLFLDK
jgi:hypothetical protein